MTYKLVNGDCRDYINSVEADYVITDPPYNINFRHYDVHNDNMPEEEYIKLLNCVARFTKKIVSHYPEETMRYVIPALGVPDHVGAWCYNGNIARRFRLINYYGIHPDYSKVKQPYKNPGDKRIKKLIEKGSEGASVYEWWSDIQIVKNVSKESQNHPCPLPFNLVERIVLVSCHENGTILDPFMGSGTTGLVALKHGFDFIGIEKSKEYFEMAKNRIESFALARNLI